jgi:hypothetical protein
MVSSAAAEPHPSIAGHTEYASISTGWAMAL